MAVSVSFFFYSSLLDDDEKKNKKGNKITKNFHMYNISHNFFL